MQIIATLGFRYGGKLKRGVSCTPSPANPCWAVVRSTADGERSSAHFRSATPITRSLGQPNRARKDVTMVCPTFGNVLLVIVFRRPKGRGRAYRGHNGSRIDPGHFSGRF